MMLRRVLLVSYVQYVMYSLVAPMHNMNDARGFWRLGSGPAGGDHFRQILIHTVQYAYSI